MAIWTVNCCERSGDFPLSPARRHPHPIITETLLDMYFLLIVQPWHLHTLFYTCHRTPRFETQEKGREKAIRNGDSVPEKEGNRLPLTLSSSTTNTYCPFSHHHSPLVHRASTCFNLKKKQLITFNHTHTHTHAIILHFKKRINNTGNTCPSSSATRMFRSSAGTP